MKTKLMGLLTIFLVGILAICSIASATITINEVQFDGNSLGNGSNQITDAERGNTVEVKVTAISDTDVSNVQTEAYMRCYEHSDLVQDISDVFDMKANVTYVKKLTLTLPQRMDQDRYQLRVRVEGRDQTAAFNDYDMLVDTSRHLIDIKDAVFSPEGSVMAGRALLTSVRVKNYGQQDEDGIKIEVSVPDLGISASDYIDTLNAGDSTSSEDLYLRIPSCAKAGTYDATIKVTYHDGDDEVTKSDKVTVTEDETCTVGSQQTTAAVAEKPSIIYDSSAQEITSGGAGGIYALTISNPTGLAKTVTIGVSGTDVFGTARVSPSNVIVLGAGETKTAYVYVTADKDAKAGQYSFAATVAGLGATSQQITLAANVVKGTSNVDTLKQALEIGLVVLVVILVVLGLIIGFNKLKKNDDSEEEPQTYY
jgi:uncharacterized membrane protein